MKTFTARVPLLRFAVLPVAAALILAACGAPSSGSSARPASPSPSEAGTGAGEIAIKGFAFTPQRLEVPVGTRVTWTNQDEILHTATAGDGPGETTGAFDGTMDTAGKQFSVTLKKAGTYPYFCTRHHEVPVMHGVIVVS